MKEGKEDKESVTVMLPKWLLEEAKRKSEKPGGLHWGLAGGAWAVGGDLVRSARIMTAAKSLEAPFARQILTRMRLGKVDPFL